MSEISPILSLPYIQPSQAQKHVTHNEAIQSLDVLVQLAVADRDQTSPPGAPTDGDRHIIAAGATGAWAGSENKIAVWENGQWEFLDPLPGWRAEVLAEDLAVVFDGTAWSDRVVDFDNLPGIGINTTSDATNRLAVSAAASLFGHEGNGHQVKVNKASDADTASLLFQSGYVGHAEMGLMGGTDFSIKTSVDGATWVESLRVGATGVPVLPLGATINGQIGGTAVQTDALDTTAGRLMAIGAFGIGNTGTAPEISDLDATSTASGIYYYSSTTTTNAANRPAGAAGTGTIIVTRAFAGTSSQILTENIGLGVGGDTWYRTYNASFGAWSGWRLLYTPENVVGSVAQNAGIPTGAVIERGSNANGDYVRFADGTQICTQSLALSSSAATGWTYPAAFVAAPAVGGTVAAAVLSALVLDAAPTATAVSLSARDKADARRADTAHLNAIGRWF